MRTSANLCLLTLLVLALTPLTGLGQDRSAEISSRYNKAIKPIQDDIDTLQKKLGDTRLSISDASKIIEQQSLLQKKADAQWESTQSDLKNSFREQRNAILDYNSTNKRLGYAGAVIGSGIEQSNNLAKYPTREQFEKNKEQMSENWEKKYAPQFKTYDKEFAEKKADAFKDLKLSGIDLNKDGYMQIGEVNPYTGRTYYKYFDKNGKLVDLIGAKDAEFWAKAQSAYEALRRRQLDLKDRLETQSRGLLQSQDQILKSRDSLRSLFGSLQTASSSRMRSLDEAIQAQRERDRLLQQQNQRSIFQEGYERSNGRYIK